MIKPNFVYNAQILRVYDGDTLDVAIQLWMDLTLEVRIRLAHVDAPEIRSTDSKEKTAGLASKLALAGHLGGDEPIPFPDPIRVEVLKVEKFGRTLANIYKQGDTSSVNDWLLEYGLAKPYEGGKRDLIPDNPFEYDPEAE